MAQSSKKVGCYAFIEHGYYNVEQVELPLKCFSYDIQLADSLAFLELEQTYVNHSKKTLNVQYIFPLNPQATVVNFEISFGGKTSKGVIKSKEDAQKQFKEHQEENKRVGYGGYNSDSSKDIMKVKIGNIFAGQEVKVKLSYVQSVAVALNTFYQFRLPTAITPRYVSKLDQNKLVFEKQAGMRVEGCCYWSARLRIKSSKKLKAVFSKTHEINPHPKPIANNMWEVAVTEKQMQPNKDFSLCYTFEEFQKPSVLVGQSDNHTQAVVSFVPTFCKMEVEDAKKYAKKGKEQQFNMSKIRAEYVFLIDRSGSMDGERITKAKEALIVFLKSLPEQSYFNIMSFGSNYELLFEQSQKYGQAIIQSTIDKVKEMQANFGGTQILPPLEKCLSHKAIENYPRQIYLLTDGAVFNTSSVISYVAQHTKTSRVHTIGIGDGCSEDIIRGCAQMGKGYQTFISDLEDPSEKIIQLLDKSLSPVITNMKVSCNKQNIESIVPNPEKCPYILRNQNANFYITFKGKLKQLAEITFYYSDSLGNHYTGKALIDPSGSLSCNYIDKMVSSMEINALYAAYKYEQNQEDHLYFVKTINKEQIKQRIIKQSIEKQILTELTAFICVDESVADQVLKSKQKEQKVDVDIQPMNPKDHQPMKIAFGNAFQFSQGSQDLYEDECAIANFQCLPQEDGSVYHTNPQKYITVSFKKKGPQMLVIAKGQAQPLKRPGVNFPEGQKKQFLQLITEQNINGRWNEESLKSIYKDPVIKFFKNEFGSIPFEIWCTFAVMKYMQLFEQQSKKFMLILRKAKEFINAQPQLNVDKLELIWKDRIKGPSFK